MPMLGEPDDYPSGEWRDDGELPDPGCFGCLLAAVVALLCTGAIVWVLMQVMDALL